MTGGESTLKAIVIRPAQTDDAAAMAAYMTALAAEDLDTISRRDVSALEDEREHVLRAKLSERTLLLLAACDDQLLGVLELSAGPRPEGWHAGGLGLSVAKAWRGRGVGRRLLAAAIEEVRDWPGFCRIELECAPWNAPAIGLYESLGFLLEGRRRKALALRGDPADMLMMALTW